MRDGDREIDVTGSPAFVRQILDDLPALLARLRGEPPPAPSSIRMPPATAAVARAQPVAVTPEPAPPIEVGSAGADGRDPEPQPASAAAVDPVDERIFAVLRAAPRPLAIAAIREQLGGRLTGQQVRRILERAGDRVVTSGDRPMRYRLRG